MNQETLEILTKSISDVGYWKWWDIDEDDAQVEFGGVLLYDETCKGKEARTSSIAIMFYGNAFVIFLDNLINEGSWYEKLHNDEMEPLTLNPDGFKINDREYAVSLLNKYKHVNGTDPVIGEDRIRNAENVVAAEIDEFGFIAGGDEMEIVGNRGVYEEEDIKKYSEKWWEYWKDYWNKRGTKDAYKSDYGCEVTIPYR